MSQHQRILVIATPELGRSPALERAIELARRSGASVELARFDYHLGIAALAALQPAAMLRAQTDYRAQREAELAAVAVAAGRDGARVRPRYFWGEPLIDRIVGQVLHEGYDLVLKDVAEAAAEPLARPSTLDRALARLCPAPLLLVRDRYQGKPARILAAVAPDHEDAIGLDQQVLGAAQGLARQCEASLHLAYAVPGLPDGAAVSAWYDEEGVMAAYEALRLKQRNAFEQFAERHGVATERRHLLDGDPATEIGGLAHEQAVDILVVGSVYRRGLRRLLLGSTTEQLLDNVCCDLLVIKPEDFLDSLARHYHLDSAEALRQHQFWPPES